MTKPTCLLFAVILSIAPPAFAQELSPPAQPSPPSAQDTKTVATGGASITASASQRYGLFDVLEHGSSYGQGVFPEPFLVDDSDLEVNEARLDWLRTASGSDHSDLLTGEVEKGFGQLTLEVEAPVEWDRTGDVRSGGNWDNIDLGARLPLFEYVGKKDFFDTTFGVAIEVGIPTQSIISKNTEVVPKIFNDTRLGNFTLQTIIGYSTFIGADGNGGGAQTLEYGFVGGYTIDHSVLPIPGVMQLIPMFELSGAKETNMDRSNGITADVGIRVNTNAIGPVQPRLGAAFVFPANAVARQDEHWGVVTSLVFEY
jgi:hypothetical protein